MQAGAERGAQALLRLITGRAGAGKTALIMEEIRRAALSGEGGRVLLIVEDRGIGIPEADLPNIFSRFYRVDKARSREKGGSGLGLSIVHDAVSALGGSIEVEAREGGGTRFTVSFPEPGEGEGA